MRTLLALAAATAVSACSSAPDGPVTEAGTLATGDRTLAGGEFIDAYSVRAREGQWIKLDLTSADFDPYLILRAPSGASSDNDDAALGDREHARITLLATESGTYEIGVTSFEGGESGAYTLVYEVTDTEPPAAATEKPSAAGVNPHAGLAGFDSVGGVEGSVTEDGAAPGGAPNARPPVTAEGQEDASGEAPAESEEVRI